jgi:signal transduction histidine kinase
MKFSTFISANLDVIVGEWEAFAKTLPAAQSMSSIALRDHCRLILSTIAADMETAQTDEEQASKSTCTAPPAGAGESAAESHGTLRHLAGFELVELVAEFRAMRASVLSLWHRSEHSRVEGGAIEEITRFNEGIDQALAESVERYAANVVASRDMFLGVLGHDLRGPLAVIAMSNRVLAAASLSPDLRHQASARVDRAIGDMRRLIDDLLDYTRSRLGAGIPIESAACDLGQACSEAIDAIQASHPDQSFSLTLSGDLRAQADAPKMRQALGNLLNNAVQHGDGRKPICLNATSNEGTVCIQVSNSGPPIPPESCRAIFEPLVQLAVGAHHSDESSRTSMGLGLFIVREIINGHHGSITVESTAEAGTVFSVQLPRWPSQ